MPRPEVYQLTEEVYESLGALTKQDENLGWPLLRYLNTWVGPYMGRLYDIVRERDDMPGWAILFDPDLAPPDGLPYLSQFVGATLTESMDTQQRRDEIKTPSGWKRGTPEAFVSTLQRTLTGDKQVILTERVGGNAYSFLVRTLATETPHPSFTESQAIANKPMGLVMVYQAVEGLLWVDLENDYTDWGDVESTFANWQEILLTPPTP